jgi:DDE superfamily endonuclease
MLQPILTKFKNFRDKLFSCFTYRADATMNLVDALSGNKDASSVVQLSLNPLFQRGYASVNSAISNFNTDQHQAISIERCLIKHCDPISPTRPFRLLVLDCTAAPRKYSKTLADKGIVHAPNVIPGNKPITVGHQYSIVGFLPERNTSNANTPWLLPLSTRRVATNTNSIDVGIEQFNTIIPTLGKDLTVSVGDTAYNNPRFIHGIQQHEDLVHIARLQSNRIIYHTPDPKQPKITGLRQRGHELWYGAVFKLKDASTYGTPDNTCSTSYKTRKNKQFSANGQGWANMLMRDKNGLPMHNYPFTAVKITITDEIGNQVYNRPMWLMVSGKHRGKLNLSQIWQSYFQRYDVEHFFKFGKSRLLMDKFQTPEVDHEESWWRIASIAYAQLYMARSIANNLPTPWEKYLPQMKNNATVKSARQVQKSFVNITREIGTPAVAPKPRGIQLGRAAGEQQTRRMPSRIIFKREKPLQINTS